MSTENFYASDLAKASLAESGLADFDKLWTLEAGWFEEPNKRRGGWSGVSRYQLHDGSIVFIKRQQNHFYREWYELFKPVPTFRREFKNILVFQKLGIPVLELVYFGQRKIKEDVRCILITRELEGFQPLNSPEYQPLSKLDSTCRDNLIETAARVVRHMHSCRIQHNCLYAKHIFTRIYEDKSVEVRLIDMEKAKRRLFRRFAMLRDLGTLHRHTENWSMSERMRFFLAYRQEAKISQASRKILLDILNKTRIKQYKA